MCVYVCVCVCVCVFDDETAGVVVANDASPKRCDLLVHQLKRLGTPAIVFTSHDAQFFPNLVREASFARDASVRLLYDRVLADVPCSGDGTFRKNVLLWRTWNPASGQALHPCVVLWVSDVCGGGGGCLYVSKK